jgi:hypothetical protein
MRESMEKKLAKLVKGQSQDLDWAKSKFNEHYLTLDGPDAEEAGNDELVKELENHAWRWVRGEMFDGQGVSGSVEKVDGVAIGHGGVRKWNSDSGGKRDVLLTFGVAKPEDQPMGPAVFINDEEEGVDIPNLKSKFRTLNEFEGYYDVGDSDIPGTYIMNSTDQTRVEVKDESEAASEDKRRSLIQQHTDEASLDNIREYLSQTNAQGYEAAFGADMKRMNATVVDAADLENASIYTILDDTVFDPADLDDDVRDDRAQTPGMTAWCPSDMMDYGVNSQLEVYGSISTMDDGQIAMNIYGIVPLITTEMESDGDSSGDVTVSSIE